MNPYHWIIYIPLLVVLVLTLLLLIPRFQRSKPVHLSRVILSMIIIVWYIGEATFISPLYLLAAVMWLLLSMTFYQRYREINS